MRKLILTALTTLAVTGAQAGTFIDSVNYSGPVVIRNDGGGVVASYESAVNTYTYQRRRVEIRGSCRSACTLALAVPTTCVGPGAVLKWHHAYNPDTGEARYDITREMMGLTPSNIRRVVEPNIGINYNAGATLYYEDLVRLGVPDCDARPPSTFASTAPVTTKPAAADTQSLAYAPTWLSPTKPAPQTKKRIQRAPAKNVVENFFGNLFR